MYLILSRRHIDYGIAILAGLGTGIILTAMGILFTLANEGTKFSDK